MYNKSREARAASEVITTPSTPTPTARQLGRAAFKDRQAAEREKSFQRMGRLYDRGARSGKDLNLPLSSARAEARYSERNAYAVRTENLIDSVYNFNEEQYMAPASRTIEVNLMDIIQPARGKSARVFASERARHPDTIPHHLLVPGSSVSPDDYLFDDTIPAELIAELFPADEAVPAPRREEVVEVDSDRTDEEDNDGDDAVRHSDVGEDEEQWELATVGASEFSFVSVAG